MSLGGFMKKLALMTFFIVTFFVLNAGSASAVVNDTLKVGLRYGGTALFSANLENAVGEGYEFGFFNEAREFELIGWTDEIAISMTAAGDIYMTDNGTYSREVLSAGYKKVLGAWHVQLDGFGSFDEAQGIAWELGGYPAWIDSAYVVRFGCYETEEEALLACEERGGYAVRSSDTGVLVTVSRTDEVVFEFDADGDLNLGVEPIGKNTATWFKGYKYPGSFEYLRAVGGDLTVMNIVDLEDYVKGVIPYEMDDNWPLAALEAQAVCARTYACRTGSHQHFDVCSTTCCQVYYGVGSGGAGPSAVTDQAVENTAGEMLYYDGALVQNAVYHSSNGGATEDVANVWGSVRGYLKGKVDPYESQISIPNYEWSVTYTASELTWILEQKGYNIGTVKNVYVSEYTPMGNVKKVTFEGSRDTLTVTGDACRTIFYSSTYNKSVRSLRFGINGSGPASSSNSVYVNNSRNKLSILEGISVISGKGILSALSGNSFSVLTADGLSTVKSGSAAQTPTGTNKTGTFVLAGTGNGHNVGMSQYGAKAMAELGYSYDEILNFYFTDVTIE
jgi:stage II sporulation protein D